MNTDTTQVRPARTDDRDRILAVHLDAFSDAVDHSIEEITTDASITAMPFFERMGFSVVREQSVECRGVWMTNYRMRRTLRSDAN